MNELAIIALLISLFYTDLTNLLPGGIIVPFYFALYIDEPVKAAATVGTAILSIFILKLLSRFTILYGRRRFALYIVVGLLLKIAFTYIYVGNSYMFFHMSMTIGYLVPGILGNTMERQGIWKTAYSLAICVLVIKLLQFVLA